MKEKEQMEKFQTILKNLGIIQKGYKLKCIKEIENDGKNQAGLVIWWQKNKYHTEINGARKYIN